MIRSIVSAPHKVLSSSANTVDAFDKKLHSLIKDMKDTLVSCTHPKGVGLAAPQIGVGLQVFIIRPHESSPISTFVNPTILSHGKPIVPTDEKPHSALEGCLSIPQIWGEVERYESVVVSYKDEVGVIHEEEFKGFKAIIIQHEIDHLHGILYTQRVLEQQKRMYKSEPDGKGKDTLVEIEV
jgi:peptide deformylase